MLQTNEQKVEHPAYITTYGSLNGAAIITDDGKEIPITAAMIEKALLILEQETESLH